MSFPLFCLSQQDKGLPAELSPTNCSPNIQYLPATARSSSHFKSYKPPGPEQSCMGAGVHREIGTDFTSPCVTDTIAHTARGKSPLLPLCSPSPWQLRGSLGEVWLWRGGESKEQQLHPSSCCPMMAGFRQLWLLMWHLQSKKWATAVVPNSV